MNHTTLLFTRYSLAFYIGRFFLLIDKTKSFSHSRASTV